MKRRSTDWCRVRDARRLGEKALRFELTELAVEFAATPERQWTGEELAVILRQRIAKRYRLGDCVYLPTDQLPANAVRTRMP